MPQIPPAPPDPAFAGRSLRSDVLIAAAVTIGIGLLAARFEWSEVLYELTRRWEFLQLDEWPIAVFGLALCLAWMTGSRYRQAIAQLRAREVAEARLDAVLAENRRLAREHLRVQEHERKHLARELHDELGQYTNAIKLDAVAIAAAEQLDARSLGAASERILEAVNHMHEVVSGMIRRLRPAGLDELGLPAALEHMVEHWRRRLPGTSLSLSIAGSFTDLGELAQITLYRLVQEGLNNSSRHARARRIEVLLRREAGECADELFLAVRDDGSGMDPRAPRRGFGLSGMRERVEIMGGSFRVESSPGAGFRLEARLPATGFA